MYNSFNYRARGTETCVDQVSAEAVNHRRGRQRGRGSRRESWAREKEMTENK